MSIRHTGATSAPPASGARAYAVEIVRRTRERLEELQRRAAS